MLDIDIPAVTLALISNVRCVAEADWMRCESSVEPSASWHDSWNALERAYAEGHVASIGVSNFDLNLLEEFNGFGTIFPHAIQNSAQPGNVDMRVREWCSLHEAVYMPYSTQVNMKQQSESLMSVLSKAALNHGVSPHAVVSRFFLQSGRECVLLYLLASHVDVFTY